MRKDLRLRQRRMQSRRCRELVKRPELLQRGNHHENQARDEDKLVQLPASGRFHGLQRAASQRTQLRDIRKDYLIRLGGPVPGSVGTREIKP